MRRFLSLTLSAFLCLITGVAWAETVTDSQGVVYTVTSDTEVAVAAQYSNGGTYTGDIVIPETVDGYTVTSLAMNAFYDMSYGGGPSSIELPTTIKTIEDSAFGYATNLKSIVIPEGVTTIGCGVFANCTALTTVTLPSTLTSLGTATNSYNTDGTVFSKCTALTDLTCLMEHTVTLPAISSSAGARYSVFNGISQTVNLWVPCGCTDLYSDWVTMMSSYSNGGSFTVAEINCADGDDEGVESGDDSEQEQLTLTVNYPTGLGEGNTYEADQIGGSGLQKLWILISSYDASYTVYIQIGEDDDLIIENTPSSTYNASRGYIWNFSGTYTLYSGHEYPVIATVKDGDGEVIYGPETIMTLVGTTEAASSTSTIGFVSISPEDESSITENADAEFVITFDGPVKIDENNTYIVYGSDKGKASGTNIDFASIEAAGETEGDYSTAWKLTVDAETVLLFNGDWMYIDIVALDQEGNTVHNDDLDADYFMFGYQVSISTGDTTGYTFTPAQGTVESLSQIEIAYDGGISINWKSGGEGFAESDVLIYKDGELTNYKVTDTDNTFDPAIYDYDLSEILILNETITEDGEYTIVIPEKSFLIGAAQTEKSEELTLTYTIGGETETSGYTYTYDPADGATVSSLSEITVSCSSEFICSWNYTKEVTVTNDETGDVVYSEDCEDGDTYYDQVIKLASAITKAGEYTVVIPEGYFVVNDADTSEKLTIHYTIDGSEDEEEGGEEEDGVTAIVIGADAVAINGNAFGNTYYSFTIPDEAGTLTITTVGCSGIANLYTDKDCTEGEVAGTWVSYGVYTWSDLTPGTKYYSYIYGEGSTIAATYEVESGDDDLVLELKSITAADGSDLTASIVDGKLELDELSEDITVTVYCNKAEAGATWLEIQFGLEDNYLTKTSNLLSPDEDGLFTYTISYGYALEEGKEYDVVATLYNKEHQYDSSNIIGQETILTLVGTTESTASSVTLVESDPKQEDDDVTFTAGEDGVITLTFSDYVKLDESKCYLTLGQAGGSESVAIAGVDETDNGDGCYTKWTITVSASTLETYASEGNFSIAIGGVDCYGKTLYGNEGGIGMLTYYYTLVYEEGIDVNLVFDPENKTTVGSLTTIVVSDQNYDVTYNTSSTHENIPIKKDGEETAYEVYYDGTGDPGSTVTLNIVDITPDENGDQNYSATITEPGVYTFTLPATMFTVGGVVYDEDVEMEYTISGSAEGGDTEVSEAFGTSLGELAVGTEDQTGTNYDSGLTNGQSYYYTYTPEADGVLCTTKEYTVYADAEGNETVADESSATTHSYTLTGGTTYYFVFTADWIGEWSSNNWFVETVVDEDLVLELKSITAADSSDLTASIVDGKLSLAELSYGVTVTVYCNKAVAGATWLEIQFGEGDTYCTKTADLLSPDEDGIFTYTITYEDGYTLYEGKEYDVVATLYNVQHQYNASNIMGQETVLTLVGTTEDPVSDVTLVSSDPMFDDDSVTFVSGEDGKITLVFSDYVNITAEISLGLSGSQSVSAVGSNGDGNGNYTTWELTIPASTLADTDFGGEISISISGTDANGKLLFDETGYSMFTYSYELVAAEGYEVNLEFDPAQGTVPSLTTITVSDQNYSVAFNASSGNDNIVIKKDDEETSYELYYDDEAAETGSTTVTLNIVDTTRDEEGKENYNATITEAGEYTIVIPANSFYVGGILYEEDVTLVYTIEASEETTVEITLDEDGSLDEGIVVSVKEGTIALGDSTVEIVLQDADGETVATAAVDIDEETGVVTIYFKDLDEKITESGSYTLYIPEGAFTVTIGENTYSNAETSATYEYTIGTETGISAINAAIADGGEVYNLAGQKVNAPVKGNVYIIKTAEGTKKMLVK